MPAKTTARPRWPAQIQMVKNAIAADSASQKKTSAASKRKSSQFSGKNSKSYRNA